MRQVDAVSSQTAEPQGRLDATYMLRYMLVSYQMYNKTWETLAKARLLCENVLGMGRNTCMISVPILPPKDSPCSRCTLGIELVWCDSTVVQCAHVSAVMRLIFLFVRHKKWSQVAERLGNRANNQKVAGLITGRAK